MTISGPGQLLGLPGRSAPGHGKPVFLRCEYLVDPIGIDSDHPRLSWRLEDARPGASQTAYAIEVCTDSINVILPRNVQIRPRSRPAWTSGRQQSSDQLITYQGPALKAFTKYYWRVQTWDMNGQPAYSTVSSFETGMIDAGHWKGAWISDSRNIHLKPAPAFRKTFTAAKKIASARAYIAAAGLYELSINGKKIGDHRLDPMYTRFDRRNLYVVYDITTDLHQGNNAVGVLLGNGWYNHQSTAVWYFHEAPWRARPAFCLDIRITYADGSTETIATGKDWKTALSPIIFNSIYTGEHVDDRLQQTGWDTPAFNDSAWKEVIYRAAPSQHIVSETMQPIRNVEQVLPISCKKLDDTTWIYDLGRNIAGVSRLRVSGAAGSVLTLTHGEQLYPNGRVDQSNISVHYRPTDNTDPFQTDIFILNGKGDEEFMPRFNYKGFQYVEVTGPRDLNLTISSLTGFFMHSDVPPIGQLHTSNATIDKIWTATNNSYLSNLFGYPTDCPQREKNGWTGDAHIASETGLYSFDAITVYEKWLADHRDEQQANGTLPSIIPTGGWGYEWCNGPDWTSTVAIIPWNIYLFYGDKKLLADCYDNIRRYVDRVAATSENGLTSWGLGDWVPVKSVTPVELTSSAYFFADASILAKTAALLNNKEDYRKYSALAATIKNGFNAKYLDTIKGIYGTGLQTELSVPLYWGLVPEKWKATVAASLAKRVAADGGHLDVGLLGTKAILNALSENGYAALAYKLTSSETFPSWGWWIVNGATTLYENWPIDAKSDISRNHIMFGEIGAWMYKGLAGILPDPAAPGFKHILLRPHFVAGLDEFTASHESLYGKITSSWKKTGADGPLVYTAVVPPNSTATLELALPGKPLQTYNITAGTHVFQ